MSMGKKSDGCAAKAARENRAISKAAAANITKYGDQAVSFSDKFFNDYIKPQLAVIQQEQTKGIARADEVYGQQQALFQDREGTYQQFGKPAIGKYFDEVNNFDAEAEAQRRGLTAQGDVVAAQANAQAQTNRALAARGINPNSGAAINAQSRGDMAGSLVRAQEMARLRNITTQQGMNMRAQAANFGAGLGGQTAGLSAASLQPGVIGSDIATQGTGALASGAGIPMAGLQLASQGQGQIFGATKSAEASAQSAATQAAMQPSGFGEVLGTIGGLGLKWATGGFG